MTKKLLLFFVCSLTLLLCACQPEPAVRHYFCSDLYKCCEPKIAQTQTQYDFYTYLVTKEPEIEVEIVEVKGHNADQCSVEFRGISQDTTAYDFQYKGYYNRLLDFRLTTQAQEVSIESITLKINGEVAEYPFASPIHITRTEDTFEERSVYGTKLPLTFTVESFLHGRISWEFETEEDVQIESIAFDDFFRLKNVTVTTWIEGDDGEEAKPFVQSLEEGRPVKVSAGEPFAIQFDAEYADGSQWSHLDYLRMPFSLRYTELESGKQDELLLYECGSYPFAETDEDLVKAYIDHAISQMGGTRD